MDFRLTPQRLDSFFQFQSISQKYDRFCSFVDPDTFFFPERKRRDECLPHIYAGGDITYTVSSSFIMKELPLYLMMYVWKGEAAASCPGYKGALLPESLLLLPPECEWKLELSSVPFSCTLYFIGGTAVQSYLGRLQEQDAKGRAVENSAVVRSVQDPYASGVFRHINRYLPYADADACFTIAHLLTELLTKCIMEGSTPPDCSVDVPEARSAYEVRF